MFRRRRFRGSRARKRRLTWRANYNANQAISDTTGTNATMFSLRPGSGWENTEPTLLRIRGEFRGYGGTFVSVSVRNTLHAWERNFVCGLVWLPNPYGVGQGWNPRVVTDLEDEGVLSIFTYRDGGFIGVDSGPQVGPNYNMVATHQNFPYAPIDVKAKRKVRSESDDLYLVVSGQYSSSPAGALSGNLLAAWWMRFLYAVDF